MKRLSFITVAVVVVATVFCAVQALECGIDGSSSNKDLRQIADNCMKKKVEEKKKVTVDPEDEEDVKEVSTEPYSGMKRSKRNDDKSQNTQQKSSSNNDGSIKNTENNNSNTTTAEKGNCVVHCIFGQLGLVDGEGFPVHHRVLNALLNNAHSRELRDFVQDTTDECFQLMEQGEHQDACLYSITLVNCLAERGKTNCADWPIGNLPFLSKKN